jgi:2-polyprenyl-3-methyl-5-hydroxy-6-metoxy-1,4-benzoquinol methylase
MRWHEISTNPIDDAVRRFRQRTLESARRPPIESRVDYLAACARGKRVLDIGVANHTCEGFGGEKWLHGEVAAAARECLGVDLIESAIQELQQRGYDARVLDVTRDHLPPGEKFDVVIGGEVIEHLGNPQALFSFASDALDAGGRFIVSSPNPYYLTRVLAFLAGRGSESADHVALLFPSGMAELGERAGLALDAWRGVRVPLGTWRGRLLLRGSRSWLGGLLTEEALCDTLIYEFIRPT